MTQDTLEKEFSGKLPSFTILINNLAMINQLGHINQQLGNDIHIIRMYVSTTHLYHGYDQHLGVSVQILSVDVEPVLSSWFERQQPLLKQSCTSNKKSTHLTSSSYPPTIGVSDMTSKFPNNKIATDTASETFLHFSAGLCFWQLWNHPTNMSGISVHDQIFKTVYTCIPTNFWCDI